MVQVKSFILFGLIAMISPADVLSAEDAASREESVDHPHVYRIYAGGCSRSMRLLKVFRDLDLACDYYAEIKTKFLRHSICRETVDKREGLGYWTEPKRHLIFVNGDEGWKKTAEAFEPISLTAISDAFTKGETEFVVIRDLLE